jgi:polysaccharide biosynthesis protein PslH
MADLLYISPSFSEPARGGRALLTQLHRSCLHSILDQRFAVHELGSRSPRGIRKSIAALAGQIDGANAEAEAAVLRRIDRENVSTVFLNGSNLGCLARAIKRHAPAVKVISFFHNVEARFFLGSFKHNPGPRTLAVLVANYVAERMAVRSSDRLIALSRRDGDELKRLYGRGATDIVPMAIEEPGLDELSDEPGSAGYLLFVGGAFYGNVQGMRWFARNVAPDLSIETLVIGHGFEAHRTELERCGRVRVVGPVGDLGPYYAGARAVIAPIFDGAGMKTKVAEALMHGRQVIGTPEAFAGYEASLPDAGWVCSTSEDFIRRIRSLETGPALTPSPALKMLFKRHYSRAAIQRQLAAIVGCRDRTGTANADTSNENT